MKTGIEIIADERQRQVVEEGWTSEHDNQHTKNELVRAAVCYAVANEDHMNEDGEDLIESGYWPWHPDWFKPSPDDRIRELAKAGALIAAEIDRLQRINQVNHETTQQTIN